MSLVKPWVPALQVTYSGHIWQQKIRWLCKHISIAAVCVCELPKPPSMPEALGALSTSIPAPGGAAWHHAARSWALSSACPVPLPTRSKAIPFLALWVCLLPKIPCTAVARPRWANRHGKGSAAWASARGVWRQSYQNAAFGYKLQVLKIHVIIVLSGSKCAYDAERGQIGLCLKQALPFS